MSEYTTNNLPTTYTAIDSALLGSTIIFLIDVIHLLHMTSNTITVSLVYFYWRNATEDYTHTKTFSIKRVESIEFSFSAV